MTSSQPAPELERTLGLPNALTIGIGTMVGAGIFVFPGLAAGEAGPAAALSFLLGAVVALAVALPASELATAMPHSGGGYFFVSRSLGSWAGTLVGVGQWFGLVFASAFYLVGFGEYGAEALSRAGLESGNAVVILALGAAGLLMAVGLVGAEKTGGLQNGLVGILLVVLSVFLGYGSVRVLGLAEGPWTLKQMAPYGALPIATTAALVFTSYLGFVQVATVAGEVSEPSRNLPRAMVGSVLIVAGLYVVTLLVSVGVLGSERLGELGETALVSVGVELLGSPGGLVILGCGVLATLSSANASLLSASRAVFALSRDGLVPEVASRVNHRFGTPDVSLALAGVPTGALIAVGGTQFLAEVASLLHLVMYGAICVALMVLRHQRPAWYAPSFLAPGGPVVPAFGALASFALIGFMQPLSMVVGAGVFAAAGLWHLAYGRKALILPPPSRQVTPPRRVLTGTRLLVPYYLPDAPPLAPALVRFIADMDALLVGIYEIPQATDPEQAREELSDSADAELQEEVARMKEQNGGVTSRLVFTPDPQESLRRLLDDSSDLLLFPCSVEQIRRVLVPVLEHTDGERLALGVAALVRPQGRRIDLILVQVGASDDDAPRALSSIRDALVRRGLSPSQIHTRREDGDPATVLLEEAAEVDLIVTSSGGRDGELGGLTMRLVNNSGVSVMVLRDTAHDSDSE